VILRHPKLFEGQDLFTLYAHLSVIEVAVGDQVDVGMKIGEVGASGAADGSHLHFEVRLGDNDYERATNPILWFAPIISSDSGGMSTLTGRIIDPNGVALSEAALVFEKIGADGSIEAYYYPFTYPQNGIFAHPQLNENFAVSDIPPGDYRLAMVYNRLYELYFKLDAGHVGFVELQLE
jgi:murein DD-endopeptidase MepM/ murein hydrolase activator NlpD